MRSNLRIPDCGADQINTRDGPDWIWWLVDSLLDSTELKLVFIAAKTFEERLNLVRCQLEVSRLINV